MNRKIIPICGYEFAIHTRILIIESVTDYGILIETKLDDAQIPESNVILFNGAPIEEILDIEISQNSVIPVRLCWEQRLTAEP